MAKADCSVHVKVTYDVTGAYPCDRGFGDNQGRGYHFFPGYYTGVPTCVYCGLRAYATGEKVWADTKTSGGSVTVTTPKQNTGVVYLLENMAHPTAPTVAELNNAIRIENCYFTDFSQ